MTSTRLKYKWITKLTPVQVLIILYLLTVAISTILLSIPYAYQDEVSILFIDKLFVAVSAISVTGLTTVQLGETFSTFGIILITILLHLGAVGVMATSTLIWLFLGKKIGLAERRLIMTDQNQTSFTGMVRLIKEISILVLVVEGISILILGLYYQKYYATLSEAFFNGYFTTITAISNGGFDLSGESMQPFSNDYFIQSIVMFLIIFGAIGYPVLIEIREFLFKKRNAHNLFRFSLFFKITTITFFGLIVIGTIGIYLLDYNRFFMTGAWHEKLFYALFQSVTTRSGGLSTLDIDLLTDANQLFISLLMFIGASPSSAGGGIRTTTFALVLLFIIAYARGKKHVRVFNREINEDDLVKAISVFIVAIFIMFISVLFISMNEEFTLQQILFEVTSAFGTVGLSLGITGELSSLSKIALMILMFVGRVGILTILFSFKPKKAKDKVQYPKEKILIG
ncbi:TrkH family potassium uptake protein [Oceanobacillus sp. CAU 1775]